MTTTFAPRPGAAPLGRQALAQARMETRLLLRNGEQLLLALVIPVLVLVGGVAGVDRLGLSLSHTAVDELAPGVLGLALMSTSFTSLAIATGFERRYGVLKRLGASPLPRHGLLLGKVGSLLVVEALQAVVLVAVALVLGWSPELTSRSVVGALVVAVLGTAAFASLGLLVAGALRAEATLALANLVYVLLAAGGAVLVVDEKVADRFAAPGDETERMMYGWSVLHCLPTQLVEQSSAALGTVMREADVRRLASEAGFTSVEVLPVQDDLFRLYRLDA